MLEVEKKFINTCIKKHIRNKYTQEEFAKGITDKYMISRLFHGYTTKVHIYEKLLARLDFYYEANAHFIACEALYSSLLLYMEKDFREGIIEILNQLKTIISHYPHHLYYEEINEYVRLLETHYIFEKSIEISSMDFSTLSFMPFSFQIAMIHAICENLLFNANFVELETFYNNIHKPKRSHMLLQFWRMVIEQAHKRSIEAYKIYRNNIYHFIEDHDTFNTARFLLVHLQADIRKHPDTVLNSVENLENKFIKQNYDFKYEMFIPFIYAIVYIRKNKYEIAYAHIEKAMHAYDYAHSIFFPYYMMLSILLQKEINTMYFKEDNKLNKACIHLYRLNKEDTKQDMLRYIIQNLPKMCCENPYFETMIPILQQIVLILAKQTRCYKSVMKFVNEYQKYNRNYYM